VVSVASRFLLKFGLLVALCAVSGCAFTEDSVDLKYNPPANLSVVQGAQALPVAVEAKDGRASNEDRVSSKKNGYGMETARIVSSVDVTDLFCQAVEHEMNSFGFPTGAGGLQVNVEVQTLYNDFKSGFFSGDAIAEAAFNLTITSPDGTLIYAHSYKGIGMNKNIMMATGSQAQPALQEALRNAMQSFVADPALQTALQQAVQKGQSKTSYNPKTS
jgi:uncharacterized lipoprotein YajG